MSTSRAWLTPYGIESVWAVLKRGLEGTFHHVSVKPLDRYVNEFTFRLNEGNCQIATEDRIRALFQAMPGEDYDVSGVDWEGLIRWRRGRTKIMIRVSVNRWISKNFPIYQAFCSTVFLLVFFA